MWHHVCRSLTLQSSWHTSRLRLVALHTPRRIIHVQHRACTTAGKTSNDFKYLTTHAPAEDQDFTGLAEVQDAIRELGIDIEDEKDVFKALGGLLHLGQVRDTPDEICRCKPKPKPETIYSAWYWAGGSSLPWRRSGAIECVTPRCFMVYLFHDVFLNKRGINTVRRMMERVRVVCCSRFFV